MTAPCTFNPVGAGAFCLFSNGNKTLTTADISSAFGTVYRSDKKRYFEVTYVAAVAPQVPIIGVAIAGVAVDFPTFLGDDSKGWGYYSTDGKMLHAGASNAYGASYGSGTTIGCVWDPIGGTLEMFRANVSQGVFSDAVLIGASVTPCVGAASTSNNQVICTLRCALADFQYAVPAGAVPWDDAANSGNFFALF